MSNTEASLIAYAIKEENVVSNVKHAASSNVTQKGNGAMATVIETLALECPTRNDCFSNWSKSKTLARENTSAKWCTSFKKITFICSEKLNKRNWDNNVCEAEDIKDMVRILGKLMQLGIHTYVFCSSFPFIR